MKKLVSNILLVCLLFAVGFFGMGFTMRQLDAKSKKEEVLGQLETDVENETENEGKTPTVTQKPETKPNKETFDLKSIHILSTKNINEFLSSSTPSYLIIGNFNSIDMDPVTDLLIKAEDQYEYQKNAYLLNTDDTDFNVEGWKIHTGAEFQLTTFPGIYYISKGKIHYQKSFRDITSEELNKFFESTRTQ